MHLSFDLFEKYSVFIFSSLGKKKQKKHSDSFLQLNIFLSFVLFVFFVCSTQMELKKSLFSEETNEINNKLYKPNI